LRIGRSAHRAWSFQTAIGGGFTESLRANCTLEAILLSSLLKNIRDGGLKPEIYWTVKTPYLHYSPHIPRRGAPQGQGPDSCESPWWDVPETANTDNSFSTCALEQFLQRISAPELYEIFSNFDPQSWHWYSKIGIRETSTKNIANLASVFN